MSLVLDSILGSSGLVATATKDSLLRVAGGSVIVQGDDSELPLIGQVNCVISSLAVSPVDSTLFAVGQSGSNPDVTLFQISNESVEKLVTVEDHDSDVTSLTFSVCGSYLFSVSSGQFLVHQALAPYSLLTNVAIPHINTSAIVCAGYVRDIKRRDTSTHLLVSCGNKNIHFWHFNPTDRVLEGMPISSGLKQVRDYTCPAVSSDREVVLVGTTSGDVLSVTMKTRTVQCISAPLVAGGVCCIAVKSEAVAIGGGDGSVVLGKLRHTEVVMMRKLDVAVGRVKSIVWRDDSLVVAGTAGVTMTVTEHEVSRLHRGSARKVAMLRYARNAVDRFYSVGEEVVLWQLPKARSDVGLAQALEGGKGLAAECVDGVEDFFVVGGGSGKLYGFSTDSEARRLWVIDGATRGRCIHTRVGCNKRYVIAAGSEGEVRLFDLKSKEMMVQFKEHVGAVTGLEEVGGLVVSSGKDRSIVLCDLKAEKRVGLWREKQQGINGLALIPNADFGLVTAADRGLSFWDLRMQEAARTVELQKEARSVTTAGASGVVGDIEGVVSLWDMRAGSPIVSEYKSPARHVGEVVSVAMASDGKSVVSAGVDRSIFVWNIF